MTGDPLRLHATGHGIADLDRVRRLPLDAHAITAWTRTTHHAREVYRALPIAARNGAPIRIGRCCCQTCRRKP